MTPLSREATILDRVRQSLEAEGFEVLIEPGKMALPSFLEGLRPDAIAFGKGKNLVVEVTKQTPAAERRLQALQELVAAQPGWELRLVWTSSVPISRPIQQTPAPLIESTISDIESLIASSQYKAAFLLAWSSLEAVGRALQPMTLARPQTPARLVEQLAATGAILPVEADELRDLISKRNRLSHGELRTDVKRRDVLYIVNVIKKMTEEFATAA